MKALRYYHGQYFAAWVYEDHAHTILVDGTATRGYPPQTPEFRQSAMDLGYGEDVYQHIVEHDLLHSLLSQFLWNRVSIALWNQAHDQDACRKPTPADAEREEYFVGAAQAALNGHDWGRHRLWQAGWSETPFLLIWLRQLLRPKGEAMTSAWAKKELARAEERTDISAQ